MSDLTRKTLHAQPTSDDALVVAAAPIERLLDALKKDIDRLKTLAPEHELVEVYKRFRERVWQALQDAKHQQVWLSTAEAAERLNCSQSHIQHLCGRDPDDRPFTATKIGGAWRIAASTLPTLEAAA